MYLPTYSAACPRLAHRSDALVDLYQSKVHAVFLSSMRDFTQAQLLGSRKIHVSVYTQRSTAQFLVSDPTTSAVENVRNGACQMRSLGTNYSFLYLAFISLFGRGWLVFTV